jgi:competence protein ComEA
VPPALAVAVLAAVLLFAPTASPTVAAAPGLGAEAVVAAGVPADAEAAGGLPPAGGLLVEVTGAVAHPGLYRMAKGERVLAAITAAGGLASDADPNRLPDMAARLKDGQQVKVPGLGTSSRTSTRTSTAASGSSHAPAVSLNAATADQLAIIPGFTPDLANAVIGYRTQFGGFASTRELVDVLNMSEADYLLARPYVHI